MRNYGNANQLVLVELTAAKGLPVVGGGLWCLTLPGTSLLHYGYSPPQFGQDDHLKAVHHRRPNVTGTICVEI